MSGYFRAYSNRVREASRELEERELRVYLALLSYANCEGMCWPGIKCLVDTTGLCTDAVLAALEGLVWRNYVIVVRKGTRDVLTHSMLPNVWKIDGAVIDDDCADDVFRTDDPILALSSNEESQHHHRTDSYNTTKETQPETPPPTQPESSKVVKQKAKTETPTRSVNTNATDSVPRNFYSGPLVEFAAPLAADDEQVVADLREIDARMTIRTARYLVASGGAARAVWAMAHYRKQTNVFNPAGYIRALIERQAVESVDSEQISDGERLRRSWGQWADS